MLSVKEKAKLWAENRKEGKAPPISQDHIVKIQPDRDIVLALDENGNELCKFQFEINENKAYFNTPTLAKYPAYVRKLYKLFLLLSQYAKNVELPDDLVKDFNDPLANNIWKRLSGVAITSHKSVIKLVIELFFNYLDGRIEGVKKPIKWFKENARIQDMQKIFACCLCVDELIKKNAIFLIEKEIAPTSAAQSLKRISQTNQKSHLELLTLGQSSSYEPL